MKKFSEISSMSVNELQQELATARSELHELRLGNALKQLKETHKLHENKRYVAQLLTALKQIPVEAKTEKPAEVPELKEKKVAKTTVKKTKKVSAKKTT